MNECRDAFEKYDEPGLPFSNEYERATARHAFESAWRDRQHEIDQLVAALERIKEYGKAPCKGDYTAVQIAKDALAKHREACDA